MYFIPGDFGVSLSFLRTGKEPTGLDEDSLDELCGLLKYCDKKLEQTEEDIEETRTIIKKIFELMNP